MDDENNVVGKSGALLISKKRFDRVAQRIIRGLFYQEFGRRLPDEYEVQNTFNQQGFPNTIDLVVPRLHLLSAPKIIGNGVFSYRYGKTREDENSTIWLSMFYEALPFIGFTYKRGPANASPQNGVGDK